MHPYKGGTLNLNPKNWWQRASERAAEKYATHPKLYLAYGSNLDKTQMRLRCDDAEDLFAVELYDYKLAFSGVANILPEEGTVCPCGLWRVSCEDIEALDRYEGYPTLYDKTYVNLEMLDGSKEQAFVYELQPDANDLALPWATYLETLITGYEDWDLDRSHLAKALLEAHEAEEADGGKIVACDWCTEKAPAATMEQIGKRTWMCLDCLECLEEYGEIDYALPSSGYYYARGTWHRGSEDSRRRRQRWDEEDYGRLDEWEDQAVRLMTRADYEREKEIQDRWDEHAMVDIRGWTSSGQYVSYRGPRAHLEEVISGEDLDDLMDIDFQDYMEHYVTERAERDWIEHVYHTDYEHPEDPRLIPYDYDSYDYSFPSREQRVLLDAAYDDDDDIDMATYEQRIEVDLDYSPRYLNLG